jgi:Tol biopolymer transport system component
VAEPALSPDGTLAAFVVGGRIGLATLASGDVRLLTLGVDWKDASPAWLPDGRGLVVCSRRTPGERADLHLLAFDAEPSAARVERRALLTTPAFDESQPVVSADGSALTFLRGEHLFRLTLADGRVKRLTGGFRQYRALRRLPSGRLLALWSEAKQFGMDQMDADGANRETVAGGTVFYRNVAPSPDGRYLAATFTYDLGFHPLDALRGRSEELHLLDAHGRALAVLARSWRRTNHSPAWGR